MEGCRFFCGRRGSRTRCFLVLTRKSRRSRAVVSFVEGEGVEPGPEGHPVFKTGAHPRRPHLPSRCAAELAPPDRVELSRRVSKTQVGSVRGGIGTSRKNRTFSASFVDQRPVHRWRYRMLARPLGIEPSSLRLTTDRNHQIARDAY